VARRLFLVEDDLMFGQRARAAAARLGVIPDVVSAADARTRPFTENDVVLVQATIRPAQQEALIKDLTARDPAPLVVAVTGHLETELRQRLRQSGARLASHSAIDRTLARALGLH
jgi:hypothetical protein